MENLCSIGELAAVLGVAIITLRRWHAAGTLVPAGPTPGGHRRYDISQVRQVLGHGLAGPTEEQVTLGYARVSSHDQKEQLQTQAQRLQEYCKAQGYVNTEVITDLGSGTLWRLVLSRDGLPKPTICRFCFSWVLPRVRWAAQRGGPN